MCVIISIALQGRYQIPICTREIDSEQLRILPRVPKLVLLQRFFAFYSVSDCEFLSCLFCADEDGSDGKVNVAVVLAH